MLKGKHSEVVLVINCPNELVEKVEQLLWEHLALGVAQITGLILKTKHPLFGQFLSFYRALPTKSEKRILSRPKL